MAIAEHGVEVVVGSKRKLPKKKKKKKEKNKNKRWRSKKEWQRINLRYVRE